MKSLFRVLASAIIGSALLSSAALADTILYYEDFQPPVPEGTTADQNVALIHWAADIQGGNQGRLFTNNLGLTPPDWAGWSWANGGAEAFFTDRTMNSGFTAISLDAGQLTFSIDMASNYQGENTLNYFAVQMNDGQWYVSTTNLGIPPATFTTYDMVFNAAKENWLLMTVNAGGTDGPAIGGTPLADLTGSITGVGFVVGRTGDGTTDFRNFVVAVPEPSSMALAGAAMLGAAVVIVRRKRAGA